MSQLTSAKLPSTAATGAPGTATAWTSPDNAKSSTDSSAVASTTASALGTPSQTLALTGFNLLSEDGGTIPAGATIIRVVCVARIRTQSGNDFLGNTGTTTTTSVKKGGASGTALLTDDHVVANNTNSGLVTRTLTTGGTIGAPQSSFVRADLANSSLAVCVQGKAGSSLLTSSTHECDYATVQVEWVLYSDETGAVLSEGVAASTKKLQMTDTGAVNADSAQSASKKIQMTDVGGLTSDASSVGAIKKEQNTRPSGPLTATDSTLAGAGQEVKNRSNSLLSDAAVPSAAKLLQITDSGMMAFDASTPSGPKQIQMTDTGGLTVDQSVTGARKQIFNTKQNLWESDAIPSGAKNLLVNKVVSVVSDAVDLTGGVRVFTYSFAGIIRDGGVPVSGATVELFETPSGIRVATATTGPDGAYSFTRRSDSGEHFVYAFKTTPTRKFGATDRNLIVDENEVPRP